MVKPLITAIFSTKNSCTYRDVYFVIKHTFSVNVLKSQNQSVLIQSVFRNGPADSGLTLDEFLERGIFEVIALSCSCYVWNWDRFHLVDQESLQRLNFQQLAFWWQITWHLFLTLIFNLKVDQGHCEWLTGFPMGTTDIKRPYVPVFSIKVDGLDDANES